MEIWFAAVRTDVICSILTCIISRFILLPFSPIFLITVSLYCKNLVPYLCLRLIIVEIYEAWTRIYPEGGPGKCQ